MIIAPHSRFSGEVKLVLMDLNGRVLQDTGWSPNLITNTGLTNMGFIGWAQNCNIGSSAAAPAFTDTALASWLAEAQSYPESSVVPTAPNWELITTQKARFNAGVGTGTIREIGFNLVSAYPDNTGMNIRALASPEVTKSADQVLDVYHRMTRWPDLVDRTGVVSIEGVDYNYIVRASQLDSGSPLPTQNDFVTAYAAIAIQNSLYDVQTYTDNISTVDSEPSAPISNGWCTNGLSLGGASGYQDYTILFNLDNANGNIRSFRVLEYGHGLADRGWQVRLGKVSDDSPLVKDNTKELEIDFRVTWARYP